MKDFFRDYWLVSRDFWRSKAGLVALLILVVCVLFEFTSVALSVYLNHWYVAFYNAVEQYDKQTLLQQLLIFAAITSAMLLNSFLSYFCGQYLIIFMCKPMTENYVSNWLNSKSYLSCTTIYDNP
ncbi:SbmA/BacA-like family transporter [Francisella tularensis]|uniref:SbmA/BacA-like family transporter n=1 Tax=Francisella tularensis TaxID=263 RepID=UPI002351558D|nr:SbmA/BacA-like family transporter [Francisella tularensis]